MKVMDNILLIRYNNETKEKIDFLIKELPGHYTSKAQLVRSAIHFLYNYKLKEIKKNKRLLNNPLLKR